MRGHDSATMLVLGQGAPPELLQLVRVLPIGQSVVHDGLELTALSLETYADGFLVNTRLLPAPAPPLTPESAVYPEFRLHATDERGGRYEGRPSGANGEGRQWRFTHVFMPALDAAVRELRLEVSEVRWQPFGRDKQPEVVQTGPWRFVVALPGDGHGVP